MDKYDNIYTNGVYMKRLFLIFIVLFIFIPTVEARRGCCSHHGGVAGCTSSGRQICNDGTLSKTCTCTPTSNVIYVYGCMDKNAKNYNSKANRSDGSCIYYIYGCTDKTAKNYNSKAEKDDNSCEYYILGCMDKRAKNYNPKAEKDDGNCTYAQSDVKAEKPIIKDNNKKEEIINNTSEKGTISAMLFLIFSFILLFSKKVLNKTLIAKKIMSKNTLIRIFLISIYILTIIPPIIDGCYLIYKIIKK